VASSLFLFGFYKVSKLRKGGGERKREKGRGEQESAREDSRKKKLNSPQDGLLLVGLGVGEALDGARLAPEEPAEVGALVGGAVKKSEKR